MLKVGATVPEFTVFDDEGKTVSLSAFRGAPLVLYFYPKDDTPGCTTEASEFRDVYPQFQRKNAQIAGVSRDGVESHQRFKKKYGIPFPLLSDVSSELCDAFGTIVEKNMYGRKSKGVARCTFLIDENGIIAKVWPKVKVDGHAQEVLASL